MKLTPAGHDPNAYEVIRQALIKHKIGGSVDASRIFAFIHDAGLRIVPKEEEGRNLHDYRT